MEDPEPSAGGYPAPAGRWSGRRAPVGFAFEGPLGRGAHTVAYRVRRDGRCYALKVRLGSGQDGVRALRREAAAVATVRHPQVARVHEVGVLDGDPYLVMDLAEGRPLDDLLRDGPRPVDQVVAIGRDVADTLAATHRAGLVHCDVKPANLVVDAGGRTRVLDFGLAARPGCVAQNTVAGTMRYCAPEQAGVLNRPVDGRADLYALGAVLFECATGAPPFEAADVGELLRQHASVAPPDVRDRRPDVPGALADVIARLLAKDPDDRYSSGAAVVAALDAALDPGPDAGPDVSAGSGSGRSGTAAGERGGCHPRAGTEGGPAPVGAAARLVGRDDERAALEARWRRAREGQGGAVLVQGPGGAGKSRLVRDLADAITATGGLVLAGKGHPDESTPLAPLRAAIDGHVAHVRRLPEAERAPAVDRLARAAGAAAPLLATLSPALGELIDAPRPVDDGDQQPFSAAVVGFLGNLAAGGGALLHLDDLQWLDAATRRVLATLAVDLPHTPLLVVGTARDDAASAAAVADVREDLGPAVDLTLDLRPLGATAVTELVADLTGGMRLDLDDAVRLAARSQGNALTLLEYLAAVMDAGLLSPSWGRWVLDVDGLDELDLPGDAVALILDRLAGLDDETRRVLGVAAALGAEFPAALLADVTGTDRAAAADVCALACWRQLVEARGSGRYRFVHDRVREALLASFTDKQRRAVHGRIADVLAAGLDGAGPPPAAGGTGGTADPTAVYALARHSELAGEDHRPERRFTACLAAGRLALADHAPAEALAFLRSAMDAAGRTGIGVDAEVLRTLGVAQHRAGHYRDAVASFERALASTVDPFRRAQLLELTARVHDSTWDTAAQVATVEQALTELGRPLPRNPIALAVSTVALLLAGLVVGFTRAGFGRVRGDRRERYGLVVRLYDAAALAHARELRPKVSVVYTLRQVWYVNRLGRGPERVRMKIASSHLAYALGLAPLARRLERRAVDLAEDLGDPRLTAYVEWLRSLDRCFFGIDQGEAVRRTFAQHARWLDAGHAGDLLLTLVWVALARGDLADAQDLHRRRNALVAAAGQTGRLTLHASEAVLPAMQGRSADAVATLARLRAAGADILRWELVDALLAAMMVGVEVDDLDGVFGAADEEFDALGISVLDLVPAERVVYVARAYGRIARCRAVVEDAGADAEERAGRLRAAERAVRDLRRAANTPILRAHHAVVAAALHDLRGDPRGALQALDRSADTRHRADAPLVAFEVARLRARALRALGVHGEADRQARVAHDLAATHDWPLRARRAAVDLPVGTGPGAGPQRTAGARDDVAVGRYRQRLRAIEEVGLAASRVLDPTRLAIIALDETIRILGAERAFLFLVDDQDHLAAAVGRTAQGTDVDELTEYSTTLVEQVRQRREALVVTGTDEGAALGSASVVLHGLRSIMVAPLLVDGRLLGVVYLDSRVAKGIFTADDVGVLTAITSPIAVALATARAAQLEVAIAAAHRQRDLAETLRAALADLTGTLDPHEVLRRLATTIARLTGSAHAWVVVGSGGEEPVRILEAPTVPAGAGGPVTGSDWALAATSGAVSGPAGAAVEVSLTGSPAPVDHDGPAALDGGPRAATPVDAALTRLLSTRQPVLGNGAEAPALVETAMAGGGDGRAWMAVPLAAREGPIGLVLVAAPAEAAYTEPDAELAAALAGQGAIAYENARLFARVQLLASVDDLTGVDNRRHFFARAEEQLAAARRDGGALAALMIDVDHFKDVNDAHGHRVGDDVLRIVADRLAGQVRPGDVLGRYGGEEFAVVLREDGERAEAVAERLRRAVAAGPVRRGDRELTVTVSVGVAHLRPTDTDLSGLLVRADAALYLAKHSGRNRVESDSIG